MEIKNTFYHVASKPDLHSAVGIANNKNSLDFNCMRIGIVQEFFPEDLTVSVLIANKKDSKQFYDGTQETRNYALVRAKVCFCNPFITNEIKAGDECILLFSDREIESWFVNGDVNPVAYQRMHDLTDAVAILGIRSLPSMIEMVSDCLHLFYGASQILLKDGTIDIVGNTTINGNTQNNGNITATGQIKGTSLWAGNGATGTFKDRSDKQIEVSNGIITYIEH